MKNALILLAGGSGKRMGLSRPKQFYKIGNLNLIEYFLTNLDRRIFDIIIIASKTSEKKKYLRGINKKFNNHNIKYSNSGKTRQLSVKNSLVKLKNYKVKNVLIHDTARPLTSNSLIKKIIKNLKNSKTCIPYVMHNDLIKTSKNIKISKNDIFNIQTPQGFDFDTIYNAHINSKDTNLKDDSSLIDKNLKNLKMIKGDLTNIKITNKKDIQYFERLKITEFRSGIGYDIHKIDNKSKKKLILCGVKIKHPPLIGHSDADVGYHAICDSILGSISKRDMGYYFNNKNDKWKNMNSKIFLKFCKVKLEENNFTIVNLDLNFICEKPNINKIQNLMKINISKILDIPKKIISIKATTNEKIGFIGKGEGIAAESIVQIKNA